MAHALPFTLPFVGPLAAMIAYHYPVGPGESRVTLRILDVTNKITNYMPGCFVNRPVEHIAYKATAEGVEVLYGGKDAKRAALVARKEGGAVLAVTQLTDANVPA